MEGRLARASEPPDRANRYESSKKNRAVPLSSFYMNPCGNPCGVVARHLTVSSDGGKDQRPTAPKGAPGQPRARRYRQ